MKHLAKHLATYCLVGVLSYGFSTPVRAQSASGSPTVRLKVTEERNGKKIETERVYSLGEVSEEDRKAFVDKLLDSLGTDKTGNRQVMVTVENQDGSFSTRDRRRIVMRNHDGPTERPSTFFEFDSDDFNDQVRRIEREVGPRMRIMMRNMERFGERMGETGARMMDDLAKPASIRGLNAYPNNPDNSVLNLRFSVPEKGDVLITVTDTKGKEVAKKEVKDFSGEFVGQVELKKNTKGTLFVSVVQREDGAVKRIVIP